jgi:hypothetical protein
MSLPKAQLVDPQGNMNLPGMTATGIVTASSLKGVTTGSATGLTGNPDLDVGIVTASSFVGQGDGHAANLTGTPQLNLGVTTSTGFVGDAVGKAAGLTGTPNLNVGLITATSFVGFVTGDVTGNITGDVTGNITGNIQGDVEGNVTGNVSGLARGLGINGINVWTGAGTSNLGVGVATAIQWHGDGSGLVGAGSSAYIAQEVTASGDETIIDLSYGNLIYYQGKIAATTVGFASTSAAEQITFIRSTSQATEDYNISYSTGGVEFDGDDWLSIPDDSDFTFGTSDFTIECWFKTNNTSSLSDGYDYIFASGWPVQLAHNNERISFWMRDSDNSGSGTYFINNLNTGADSITSTSDWYHIAVTRSGSTFRIFLNGVLKNTETSSESAAAPGQASTIGRFSDSPYYYANATISNFRYIKGTALYTNDFTPPSAALTNVTNTKLLCCQSDSSTTTAAVIPTGSITTGGDPTAAAETVAASGTITFDNGTITWPDRVKWNNNTTPTLIGDNPRTSTSQLFRFTTFDTGLNYNAWEEIQIDSSAVEVWHWGLITGNNQPNVRVSSPVQLGTDSNWTPLSGPFNESGGNMVATKTDGTLWVWGGGDNYGAPGLNNAVAYSSPMQIPGTNWSQATAGYRYNCAVKTDGTLWSWGYGERGVLGHNESGSAPSGSWYSSPTQVGTGTNWYRVMSQGNSTSAFKTDGTLWFWGLQYNGAFGQNGPSIHRSSPVQCGSGWDHTATFNTNFVKKTDGTWWTWGNGGSGNLGLNTSIKYSSPTQLPGTWAQIDQQGRTGLGVKTDGTLWTWGQNTENGLLGLNQSPDFRISSPTQIGTGTDWGSDAGGLQGGHYLGFAAAIKTDGSLYMWGKNVNGNLGVNQAPAQLASLSSPTQVPGIYTEIQNTDMEKYGAWSMRGV